MLLFYYLYVISKRSQSGHGLWNRIETTDHIEESEARYWSVFVYPIQEVPVWMLDVFPVRHCCNPHITFTMQNITLPITSSNASSRELNHRPFGNSAQNFSLSSSASKDGLSSTGGNRATEAGEWWSWLFGGWRFAALLFADVSAVVPPLLLHLRFLLGVCILSGATWSAIDFVCMLCHMMWM